MISDQHIQTSSLVQIHSTKLKHSLHSQPPYSPYKNHNYQKTPDNIHLTNKTNPIQFQTNYQPEINHITPIINNEIFPRYKRRTLTDTIPRKTHTGIDYAPFRRQPESIFHSEPVNNDQRTRCPSGGH